MTAADTYTLVFDLEKRRPACVLLQAAAGCRWASPAFDLFDSRTWLVAPTPGMQRLRGTLDEWRHVAEWQEHLEGLESEEVK